MVQYADDSIRICEEDLCKVFHQLPDKLQEESATAFSLMCMKLFYPEYTGEKPNPRADGSKTDPDAYMKDSPKPTQDNKENESHA